MRVYNDIHSAYIGALEEILFRPEYIAAPRGQKVRETTDFMFRVMCPVAEPLVTHDLERNAVIAAYTAKEVELYNSCTNKASDFAKASKFWEKLANPDGTVNSAYGYLIWGNRPCGNGDFEVGRDQYAPNYYGTMRTPWEWAKQCLISDKDSRQAIMRFSLPEHQWVGNKDQTCTMHANFLIRDNKLNLSVVMRSNDLMLGLVYDLPWFVSLMDRMIEELKEYYPELTKGHYTHLSHSMHIYDRDEAKVLKMLGMNEPKE